MRILPSASVTIRPSMVAELPFNGLAQSELRRIFCSVKVPSCAFCHGCYCTMKRALMRILPTHPSPSARQFQLPFNGLAQSELRRIFCSVKVPSCAFCLHRQMIPRPVQHGGGVKGPEGPNHRQCFA